MELIQPARHPQVPGKMPRRRLLLLDPYPRNNRYHLTASERRAVWFPKTKVIRWALPEAAEYLCPREGLAHQDIARGEGEEGSREGYIHINAYNVITLK